MYFFMSMLLLNSPVQRPGAAVYSIIFEFRQKGWAKGFKRAKTGAVMNESRKIECHTVVPAPLGEVWKAWTTGEGAVAFFSPGANIEARPGGPYEILFNLDAPEGLQGAEEMIVLAVQEPSFISFTWNAPPHLPDVRGQRTHVEVRLTPEGGKATRVDLVHGGWGTGGQWDEAFAYFSRAWPKTVLPRLVHRFENGPVDWENPPSL
jgi:uncharacterized protein YndB with AHSA1/START domain